MKKLITIILVIALVALNITIPFSAYKISKSTKQQTAYIVCTHDNCIGTVTPIDTKILSNAKIKAGTYAGQGTNYAVKLTFDFTPVIIIVEHPKPRTDGINGWFDGFIWTGEKVVRAADSTYPDIDDADFIFTASGNTVSWTISGNVSTESQYYLNCEGLTYQYIAIGY